MRLVDERVGSDIEPVLRSALPGLVPMRLLSVPVPRRVLSLVPVLPVLPGAVVVLELPDGVVVDSMLRVVLGLRSVGVVVPGLVLGEVLLPGVVDVEPVLPDGLVPAVCACTTPPAMVMQATVAAASRWSFLLMVWFSLKRG